MLLDSRRRREGDRRLPAAQQLRQADVSLEVALVNRAEHAREHFLGVRAARGAIPAAHLALHHGGIQLVTRVWTSSSAIPGVAL